MDYAADAHDDSPFHLQRKHLYCGHEHSVVARFGQHLGHSMTAIFRSNFGQKVRFGDFKAANQSLSERIPDIALMTDDGVPLMIGEAKTPWRHDLEGFMTGTIEKSRRLLGQIARYLHIFNVKYGFLTTYNETIFLKQEPHPSIKGKWVLCVSPVINHHTSSGRVNGKADFRTYRGRVSLRECFLYIMNLAVKAPRAKNRMNDKSWVGKAGKWKHDDFISDDSEHSEENYQPRPTRNPRTASSRPPPERQGADMDEVERRIQRTRIDDEAKHLKWYKQIIDVYYSRSKSSWYYNAGDNRAYITLLEGADSDGRAYEWFVAGNIRYEARRRS